MDKPALFGVVKRGVMVTHLLYLTADLEAAIHKTKEIADKEDGYHDFVIQLLQQDVDIVFGDEANWLVEFTGTYAFNGTGDYDVEVTPGPYHDQIVATCSTFVEGEPPTQ